MKVLTKYNGLPIVEEKTPFSFVGSVVNEISFFYECGRLTVDLNNEEIFNSNTVGRDFSLELNND
jgi:hypothetical protein